MDDETATVYWHRDEVAKGSLVWLVTQYTELWGVEFLSARFIHLISLSVEGKLWSKRHRSVHNKITQNKHAH